MYNSGPMRTPPETMALLKQTYKSNEAWQFRNEHTNGKWVDRPAGSEPGWFFDTEYRKKP